MTIRTASTGTPPTVIPAEAGIQKAWFRLRRFGDSQDLDSVPYVLPGASNPDARWA